MEIGHTLRRSYAARSVSVRNAMPRRSSAHQSHLSALAGHAVHSFHAKRSAAWPDLADMPPVLRRSQYRSMPPDSDAFTCIYSSPRFRTPTHCTPGALYGCLHGPVAHIGRMSLCSVQHAPPTHCEPQCGLGADCPARWLATTKSRRRRASQLLLRLQRRAHGSLNKVAMSR